MNMSHPSQVASFQIQLNVFASFGQDCISRHVAYVFGLLVDFRRDLQSVTRRLYTFFSFREHSQCPVTGCTCKCTTLDGVGGVSTSPDQATTR